MKHTRIDVDVDEAGAAPHAADRPGTYQKYVCCCTGSREVNGELDVSQRIAAICMRAMDDMSSCEIEGGQRMNDIE